MIMKQFMFISVLLYYNYIIYNGNPYANNSVMFYSIMPHSILFILS